MARHARAGDDDDAVRRQRLVETLQDVALVTGVLFVVTLVTYLVLSR